MPLRAVTASVVFLVLTALTASASAQIAGSVDYTGTESGKIYVEAFTEQSAAFEAYSVSMINPGPFEFSNVEEGTYTVVAFIDANDNARIDSGEIWVEAASPVAVPPGDSNVVLDLDTFEAPGMPGGEGEVDEGCCSTVSPRNQRSPWTLVLALFLATVSFGRIGSRRLARD